MKASQIQKDQKLNVYNSGNILISGAIVYKVDSLNNKLFVKLVFKGKRSSKCVEYNFKSFDSKIENRSFRLI